MRVRGSIACANAVSSKIESSIRKRVSAKRYIAQLLLAVYLLATGGAAYASLSCRCMGAAGCGAVHICCADCDHDHDDRHHDEQFGAEWSAPCCDDRHSTEIDLYMGASYDGKHAVRCAVLALPHCMAAAQAARLAAPKFRKERIVAPDIPIPPAPSLRAAGLRAPPASV